MCWTIQKGEAQRTGVVSSDGGGYPIDEPIPRPDGTSFSLRPGPFERPRTSLVIEAARRLSPWMLHRLNLDLGLGFRHGGALPGRDADLIQAGRNGGGGDGHHIGDS